MNVWLFIGLLAGWIAALVVYIYRRYTLRKEEEKKVREKLKPFHIGMLLVNMVISYGTIAVLSLEWEAISLIGCLFLSGIISWLVMRFLSALFAATLEDIIDRKGNR